MPNESKMKHVRARTLFWEIEKIGCCRWRIEKVEKIAVKESKNWAVKKLALANF